MSSKMLLRGQSTHRPKKKVCHQQNLTKGMSKVCTSHGRKVIPGVKRNENKTYVKLKEHCCLKQLTVFLKKFTYITTQNGRTLNDPKLGSPKSQFFFALTHNTQNALTTVWPG